MKLVLTLDEAKGFLLETVNAAFSTAFDTVTFDGYSYSRTVIFETVEPTVEPTVEVQS